MLIVLGIALAFLLGAREEKRLGLPADTMIDITLVAVPCGILGSRLYFVAMEWPRFAGNLLSIFAIWEGGVAIYGAVIGGGLGVWFYCRKKKISFAKVVDMVAPGLLLAQAIGRWGNYFNMEAFGPAIQDARFQFFPLGVLIPEGGQWVWHMATFFYESLWNFTGFLSLMKLRKSQTKDGNLFLWYLLLYGSGRFIIEQLRMDSLYLGGLRVSQYVSLILCGVAGITLLGRAKAFRGAAFYTAALAVLLALARWFALATWGYPLLLFGIAALSLYHWPFSKVFPWMLLPWLLDGLGVLVGQNQWVSPAFALHFHTLLCSLTLPLYVVWLEQKLRRF